jgi:hypothetical protein
MSARDTLAVQCSSERRLVGSIRRGGGECLTRAGSRRRQNTTLASGLPVRAHEQTDSYHEKFRSPDQDRRAPRPRTEIGFNQGAA